MFPTANHLALAIKSANDVNLYRFKHGAIIYNKHRVISRGFNKPRFVPSAIRKHYPKLFLHAETDAIVRATKEELKGSSLLVVRVGRNKLCNSRPCKHCLALIFEVGVTNVYYSNVEGEIEKL